MNWPLLSLHLASWDRRAEHRESRLEGRGSAWGAVTVSLGFQEPSQDFFGALGGWSVSTMGIQFGKGTLESCWDALERLVRWGVRRFASLSY